jgi:hypothetical protein
MATAESPGGSGDRTGLPTTVRCEGSDDRSIREYLRKYPRVRTDGLRLKEHTILLRPTVKEVVSRGEDY